jgi:flagellar hook-associated protein 3 FlgL
MITRLGTFAKHNRTQDYIRKVNLTAYDLQTQISSGKKAQVYSTIAPDAARLVNTESIKDRTKQYVSNIVQVGNKLDTMEVQLRSMLDNAIQMKTTLVQAVHNRNGDFMALGQQADQLIDQTANLLNTSNGDVYLFGGTRTTTLPVDVHDFNAAPNASTIDDGYYKGDQTSLFTKIDKDFTLNYGVRADDPAFEEYFRALRLVKNNPGNVDNLRDAMVLVDKAIDGINRHVSTVGAQGEQLERSRKRHEDNLAVLEQIIGSIEDTDVIEATSLLSNQETILQASYAAVARLNRISLADYIN